MKERYVPYPGYEPAEADWHEDVPSGWDSIALGRLFRRVKRVGFIEEELLSVYRDYGVIRKRDRDDNFNKASEDLSPYQLVRLGDLVMNKMKAWQGSIAVSDYTGIVSPAYFVYKAWPTACERMRGRYIHYLLRSPAYVAEYGRRSKGIRVNQWDLDPAAFERIEALLPPLEEQTQIANFLDYETAKIDALIEKQQQLIRLLKEKRQAVISHAVTKGLNPDAPMRDSGVEWLGEVPAHWRVARINKFATKITNGYVGPTRGLFVPDGVKYLQSLHIKDNRVVFSPTYFVTRRWSDSKQKSILKKGDVLVVQTGDIGQSASVPAELAGANCHALIVIALDRHTMGGEYLSWCLNSDYGRHSLKRIQTGALHPHLNCGTVKFLEIPVPPLGEQLDIVRSVEGERARYDTLEAAATDLIDLLQERRTALISAAVTGKIDVRGWTPPESVTKQEVA